MSAIVSEATILVSYFKLLLGDISAAWFQEFQHSGNEVPAAEVVGAQRREHHILGFTANLPRIVQYTTKQVRMPLSVIT